MKMKKTARVYKMDTASRKRAKLACARSKAYRQQRDRARAQLADPAKNVILRRLREEFGSVENMQRWFLLRETILWCVMVLGVRRAMLIVGQPDAIHRGWFERGLGAVTARGVSLEYAAAYNPKLAVGALRLIALAVPREHITRVIYDGIGPHEDYPPWLPPFDGGFGFASAVDDELDKKGK